MQIMAGGAASLAAGDFSHAATPLYRVGVGRSGDPYAATITAVTASSEWPQTRIFGNPVIIKPNLVQPLPAESGITTDPEVVRALVDLALSSGASEVLIVENGFNGANFSGCGYDFFQSYHPQVRLVDLNREPATFVPVNGGLAYRSLYISSLVLNPNAVFISAAKLKAHSHTLATLSMKNLIGLVPVKRYETTTLQWRWGLHERGISQAVLDLNLVRPIDYAVVDGVWGMEGDGPINGAPVKMDMVAAGKNSLAVDRVCLSAMGLPPTGVKYLTYGVQKGLGPANLSQIAILGDQLPHTSFRFPTSLPPLLEYPKATPGVFAPATSAAPAQISYRIVPVPSPCLRRVEILRTSDLSPRTTLIRVIKDWGLVSSGSETLSWDGKNDAGAIVPAGLYCISVQAKYDIPDATVIHASGWVRII